MIHNCKSFLINALRKGDQMPFLRYWLEQIVNSFDSPELFQTGTQEAAGLSQACSLRLLEAMFLQFSVPTL